MVEQVLNKSKEKCFSPKSIQWPENPDFDILRTTPIYNLESLFRNIKKFDVSIAGTGHYSIVFRLQPNTLTKFPDDFTIKLFRFNCAIESVDIARFLKQTGELDDNTIKIRSRGLCNGYRSPEQTNNLIIRQLKGHKIGSEVFPEHIDSPVCVWVKKNEENKMEPIGYSLPFIEGVAINIWDIYEVDRLADCIEKKANIYLGNRGSGGSISYNAIITPEGTPKFIDVRIK